MEKEELEVCLHVQLIWVLSRQYVFHLRTSSVAWCDLVAVLFGV